MTTCCFTGRGLVGGKLVTRYQWEYAANRMGWGVHEKTFDVLVASRDDTTKAIKARSSGAVVMTYAEFHGEIEMNGITLGGIDNTVDYHEARRIEQEEAAARAKAERAEAKAKQDAAPDELLDVMDSNPMFGSF